MRDVRQPMLLTKLLGSKTFDVGDYCMRDAMQVCLNGHVMTRSIRRVPSLMRDFCGRCGEKTITGCPKCDGRIYYTSGGTHSPAPDFCQYCSEAFPWKVRTEARRVEAEAKRLKEEAEKPIEGLQRVFSKFHLIVRKLRKRYNSRETLDVSDEYDVQDLLSALLVLYFDDIRFEEWTPSYAGKSARMDILLKKEKIVIEIKMTRKGLADKEIGDQLIIDIERYKEHADCNTLICFIYDPEGRIANSHALSGDLQSQSRDDLKVIIVVEPS